MTLKLDVDASPAPVTAPATAASITATGAGRARFAVRSFGRDCLGNVTGWRVIDIADNRVCGQFIGDLYEEGSHRAAFANAHMMARNLEDDAINA